MPILQTIDPGAIDLLRVSHLPGLGPVLLDRLLTSFGSAAPVLSASSERLRTVPGIGPDRASKIVAARDAACKAADAELKLAATLGVRIITRADPEYPTLLSGVQTPPPLLYIKGQLDPSGADRFTLALVGSRECTLYGREQADRFAAFLASNGLTIVSGGARGIDGVAHRAALRAGGRTFAVMGCGLKHCYPAEHAELFAAIADGRGALISELPLLTPPNAENFPARNRLISGISLATLVIEAGKHSGSLITARIATEEHGREVFALPGRVDSPASEGVLELLKAGGAAMVTSPADILEALDGPARHLMAGTHEVRYGKPSAAHPAPEVASDSGQATAAVSASAGPLFSHTSSPASPAPPSPPAARTGSPSTDSASASQRAILGALAEGEQSADELLRATSLEPSQLRADLTILELKRLVTRAGSKFALKA